MKTDRAAEKPVKPTFKVLRLNITTAEKANEIAHQIADKVEQENDSKGDSKARKR